MPGSLGSSTWAMQGDPSRTRKPIYHRDFLLQKINYIHLNCVRGKWKLAEHWEDYEHSSARLYFKNILDGFVPDHFEELS